MVYVNINLVIPSYLRILCVASKWLVARLKCVGQEQIFTRVFHDKEIWRISVKLSDRYKVTQNKNKFCQKLPSVGFEPMTSWSSL